ncbi:MAG: Gfo/Idh/MocA family protein [Gemmatimonadaceae bacterium]
MADQPDLHIAFIGCGLATRMHSKTLASFPRVRRYYASRDAAKATEYNTRYKGSGSFGSYEAALADDRVDILVVVTPPSSHLELTVTALGSGKHVIVEKPPFLKSTDFDIVAEEQRRSGRRVFIAENYFYKPVAFRLRELIASGVIGEPLYLHVNALKQQTAGADDWRDNAALSGGGALYEGGIHWINFVANLGPGVESARGLLAGRQAVVGREKSVLVVLHFDNGAVGTLSYSWEVPSPLRGLRVSRIYGTTGSLAFESNGLVLAVLGKKKRLIFPGVRDMLGYKAMFHDFLAAFESGREPLFDLARARRDLELVEEVYASLNS